MGGRDKGGREYERRRERKGDARKKRVARYIAISIGAGKERFTTEYCPA